ncbi:MAG: Si-specific NAD(P)(+) transhydrogenase [Deltaproteobacteria bacterium]|nr:Si-specific NAD(P)(+) transhydrogenase [Deltaproteobacteria bacterium]
MSAEAYDFVVIGSGPAGQKAAICAAKAGKKVVVVERDRAVGGACVHHGTIPSKTLRETVIALRGLSRRSGEVVAPPAEVSSLVTRLADVVAGHEAYIAAQLRRNDVSVLRGQATFITPNELEVRAPNGERRRLATKYVILAVGSRPREPKGVPVDHELIFDSDSILSLNYLPRSLVVLGGGVVASEYTSIFAALGVKVTVVDTNAKPMAFLDGELTTAYLQQFEALGGEYLASRRIQEVRHVGVAQCEVVLADGNTIVADKVLSALGRVANVDGLGLDVAGVTVTDRGLVAVDDCCRTNVPHVYAVGDVAGAPSLASSAMEQGRRAVRHALGQESLPGLDSSALLPFCAYTIPEIASVGLSEAEVIEKHGSALVGRAPYSELARAHIAALDAGMIKMVAEPGTRRLLGVQIVGECASELVHVGQMAILAGFSVETFIEATFNFPTLAEGYRVAALDIVNRDKR